MSKYTLNLGLVVITTNARKVVSQEEAFVALGRHKLCDWGDVCEEDRVSNDRAILYGERVLSVYHTQDGIKFWIITEWDRSVTTILLPSDY